MQIRVLLPVLPSVTLINKAMAEYRAVAGSSAQISLACLRNGTSTIESDSRHRFGTAGDHQAGP